MKPRSTSTWDALVAGAGPAGTAAAITLARSGASVLLVERASLPRWKVCGACLGPAALAGLNALVGKGTTTRAGAIRLDRMLLRSQRNVAALPLAGWEALSRRTLDLELVREAERAGVTVWAEARARVGAPCDSARRVQVSRAAGEVEIQAGIVVDATGLGRGLTEDERPATQPSPDARIGIGAELDAPDYPVAKGELHMAVASEGYVGLVRVESGRLNVAAAVDASSLRASTPDRVVAGILYGAGLPPLPRTLARGWRGTPALTRASVAEGAAGTPRVLRAGDAAGYVEPFTGEGIGWAFADGRSAAEFALRALDGDPTEAREWYRSCAVTRSSRERLCRVLAWGLRRPRLVGLAVTVLGAAPHLATPLMRRAARPPAHLAAARLHEGAA